jgi:hypothetical protein
MNNHGQATAGEVVLFVVVIAILVGIVWYSVTKKTEVTNYDPNSKPYINQPTIKPICGMIFEINERERDVNTNKSNR